MYELNQKIKELDERFEGIKRTLDLNDKKEELKKLEAVTSDPNLWNDQENARRLMQELGDLKKEIEEFEVLESEISVLSEFSQEEGLSEELKKELSKTEKKLFDFELKTFLSGEHDKKNAIVSIHAGQGGTEAMDWANMLYRMYLRYSEKRGWESEVLDISEGDEAGLKSVTFKITGLYAYGYIKGESGTHRLVRQSPFNADNLRQTSFALVEVLPEVSDIDLPDIPVKEEDLEWQFFRSSSKGGQNVQKVSTAVRLIHNPTGLVVTAQTERFQEQNRKIALNLLRAKLWVRAKEEAVETKNLIKGQYRPASWGNQIRSYVLHPYKMVKDLRTEVESSNPDLVLGGELDEFIEAELKTKVTKD